MLKRLYEALIGFNVHGSNFIIPVQLLVLFSPFVILGILFYFRWF